MATTCSPRGEYEPTDSMTESARARWRARYTPFRSLAMVSSMPSFGSMMSLALSRLATIFLHPTSCHWTVSGIRTLNFGTTIIFSLDRLGDVWRIHILGLWSGFDKTNVSLEHLGSRLKQVGSCTQFLDNLGLLGPVLCFVILDTNIFTRI